MRQTLSIAAGGSRAWRTGGQKSEIGGQAISKFDDAIAGMPWHGVACLMGWGRMAKTFIYLIAVVSVIGAVTVFAEEPKAAEGTLTIEKKSYQFTHAVAFETTIDNEEGVVVVLSRQAVPGEKIKEARENDKQSGDTDFGRPFLKLVFKKTGEFKYWSAAAGGTMLGRHSRRAHSGIQDHN